MRHRRLQHIDQPVGPDVLNDPHILRASGFDTTVWMLVQPGVMSQFGSPCADSCIKMQAASSMLQAASSDPNSGGFLSL